MKEITYGSKKQKLIDGNNNYLKAFTGYLRSSDDSVTVFTAQDEMELEKIKKSVHAKLKMFGINPSEKKLSFSHRFHFMVSRYKFHWTMWSGN